MKEKFEIYKHLEDWTRLQAVVQAQMAQSFLEGCYKDANDELVPLDEYYGEDINEMLNNTGSHF